MKFLTWLSRRRFPYEPLITIELSKDRLIHNLEQFLRLAPCGSIAPVLKSNAYGHGLLEIARILEKYRNEKNHAIDSASPTGSAGAAGSANAIPFFAVDSYFEAVALRAKGITTPLLVIGYARPENILSSRLKNVAFTITSLETLEYIFDVLKRNQSGKKISIHLKIDTGMGRQGILAEEVGRAIDIIRQCPSLILDGACSHLADADNETDNLAKESGQALPTLSFTHQQIVLWNALAKKIKSAFPGIKYLHLSNTDGHAYSPEIDANVSRLGIGLYGLSQNKGLLKKVDLKPVLEMKTIISGIKHLKKSTPTGYNATFTASEDMVIATIPGGYFEGIDRRLSSNGNMSIASLLTVAGTGRIPCPIIGRVSMNITTIDVSKVPDAAIGMSVVMISGNTADDNSICSIATKCGTISYDIAVHIPAHLKRIVV